MRELRLVGRGGHGVVTAGDLMGRAAVREGRWAQAIPTFGPERRGALCSCALRVDDREILLKCGSMQPDVLVLLDPTIWLHAPVFAGLADGATLVFNSSASPDQLQEDLLSGRRGSGFAARGCRIFAVDASAIALEILGRPITNTTMLGALTAATGIVRMASLEQVLDERFGSQAARNIEAARAGRDRLASTGD